MAGATNTIIQILRSSVTSVPTTLNPGEQAYSYVSDKLFVGNTTSAAVTIGGKYYVDLLDNATSANTGNTIVRRDNAGNVAFKMVSIGDTPSNATDAVNKSYLDSRINVFNANTIYMGTAGQDGYSNVHADSVYAGGSVIVVANNSTVATYTKTTAAFAQDVSVTGNLVVRGTTSYTNVQSLLVANNDIVLNANAAGYPLIDAFITVNRGAADNAAIKWNETTDKWQIDPADGSVYDIIHTSAAGQNQTISGNLNVTGSEFNVANSLRANYINANTSAIVNNLTSNNYTQTGSLIVTNNANVASLNANTFIFTTTLNAQGVARVNSLISNTSIQTATLTATGNIIANGSATSTAYFKTLVADSDIYANTMYLTYALAVGQGGTGITSVDANAVLFGTGAGNPLSYTNTPTAGQVLQYRTDGVKFGGLDGGVF